MTITIIQDLLPPNHPLDKLPMTPEYITIHETANTNPGANAKMHGEYMRSQDAINRNVMWHFTVDDQEIRQHLPTFVCGWHAGDGYNGTGNRKSIGIEICVNQDGDFATAKANAAMLVAYLIKTVKSLRPFPECVVQHNRWSGKDCPHFIRATPGAWEGFLALVKDRLGPEPWDPAREIARLMERGIINSPHEPGEGLTWATFATVINRVLDRVEGKG